MYVEIFFYLIFMAIYIRIMYKITLVQQEIYNPEILAFSSASLKAALIIFIQQYPLRTATLKRIEMPFKKY